MKKQLLLFVVCMGFSALSFGQTKFGAGATYWNDLGVQARASLNLVDNIGIIPSFSYYFADGGTVISVDGNATYNIAEIGDGMPIYGLAGLNWTRLSSGGFSDSDIGLNVGAGVQITPNIYAELFYRTVYTGDIGLNVGYYF